MDYFFRPIAEIRFENQMHQLYRVTEAQFRSAYNDPTVPPREIRRWQLKAQCTWILGMNPTLHFN